MKWMMSAALAFSMMLPALARADVDTAKIWKSKCASCHGEDGAGKTKQGEKLQIRDMASAEFQAGKDEDWKKSVTDGIKEKKKPAFKEKLSAEEIDAMVKFVRHFKK